MVLLCCSNCGAVLTDDGRHQQEIEAILAIQETLRDLAQELHRVRVRLDDFKKE